MWLFFILQIFLKKFFKKNYKSLIISEKILKIFLAFFWALLFFRYFCITISFER